MGGVSDNGRGDPRKLRVAINTEIGYKADFENDATARTSLTHNYIVKEFTLTDLAAEIGQHHNICNPCFDPKKKRFHRKKEFCESTDYIALDFDNDKEIELPGVFDKNGKPVKVKVRCDEADYLSFDDALRDEFIKKHCGILYPSPNDSPDWNRFRALFPLPGILAVNQFLKICEGDRAKAQKEFENYFSKAAQWLIWRFRTDEACKDCSRFFYGTHQSDRVVVIGGSLTKEAIADLRRAYEAAHPKPEKREFQAATEIGFNAKDASERRAQYGLHALQTAKQQIEAAPMGERHKTRARLSYLIGGYVAGGLLDEDFALAELESSVRLNTDNLSKAWKTIEDCFSEGKSDPITFEICEARRSIYSKQQVQDEDESIVLEDGEIVDPADDPPVSADPFLETYLRKVLANASRFTRARMMMAVALGFTKLPWRLLNAILAYERNKLGVKVITNDRMLDLYAENGQRSASESTLKRDKKKLWNAQKRIGIELVWYLKGYIILGEKPEDDQHFGSRYKSNLDRWTLEALALAIKKKGKYTLKDAEIKAACVEIAKQVPRCQIEDDAPKKEEPDGEQIQTEIRKALERLASKQQIAWDMRDVTLGERIIETKTLLRQFGKLLLKGADVNTASSSRRQRKATNSGQVVAGMVAEVLDEIGLPSKAYLNRPKSPPFLETAYKKGAENAPRKDGLHGGQNEPHETDRGLHEESTTYERLDLEQQRDAIRRRFIEIQPAEGSLFVDQGNSEEIIRLADELDELDRRLTCLRERGSAIVVDELVYETEALPDELLDEAYAMMFDGVETSPAASIGRSLFGDVRIDPAVKHEGDLRTWREFMGWQWSRMKAGDPLDPMPRVGLDDVPEECREEFAELLAAARDYMPTKDYSRKPKKKGKAKTEPEASPPMIEGEFFKNAEAF